MLPAPLRARLGIHANGLVSRFARFRLMKTKFLALLALFPVVAPAFVPAAAAADLPAVFGCDPAHLASVRERTLAKDTALKPAFDALVREAGKLLSMKPVSVMDKTKTADSGDKHDYFSLAPYYWPNPDKPGGLPYVRRDGKTNPESKAGTDATAFSRVCNGVELLGLAYYFTGDERYAQKAAGLASVWFLEPATRMNPNFQYAQAIRGQNSGRGAGVLDARHLTALSDGLALISNSPAWPGKSQAAMREWLGEYYEWLTTSKNGKQEAAALNNHGTWCQVQLAHLELALGKRDTARARIEKEITARIAHQIEPDGRQPEELVRTRSYHYSVFNLEPLFALATLGDRAGCPPCWTYATKDGRSLRAALAYVAAYLDKAKTWPKKDIEEPKTARTLPLLRAYLAHADDAPLRELYLKYAPSMTSGNERWMLLLPEVK